MKLTKTLKHINQNIEATEDLIERYTIKKDELKFKPVKFSHVYICGIAGSIAAISILGIPEFDLIMFASMGGFAIGSLLPYTIKKVRIAELDYQIFMNRNIINDLEKDKKVIKDSQNQKTLHI